MKMAKEQEHAAKVKGEAKKKEGACGGSRAWGGGRKLCLSACAPCAWRLPGLRRCRLTLCFRIRPGTYVHCEARDQGRDAGGVRGRGV